MTNESDVKGIPWWIFFIALLGIALTTAGAVIGLTHPGMLASPEDQINGAVRVYAGYMAARNFGIALMLVALLVTRAKRSLALVMSLFGVVQLLDGFIDIWEGRWAVAPGVFVLGLLFLFAAEKLSPGVYFRKGGT